MRKIRFKEINLASVEDMLLIGGIWGEICTVLETDMQTIAEAVNEKYGITLKEYHLAYQAKLKGRLIGMLSNHAKTNKSAARFLRSIGIDPAKGNTPSSS